MPPYPARRIFLSRLNGQAQEKCLQEQGSLSARDFPDLVHGAANAPRRTPPTLKLRRNAPGE
ncbi:hypothetical protein LG3211_2633 [Lysobacter gummosus]|nr:hypothetical protein LG3211_2633 [Lysobacter gummosus]